MSLFDRLAKLLATGLLIAATAANAQTADLSIGATTVGTIVANQNGSWTIPVTYTVTNIGAATAPASWYDLGYLSADGTFDNTDQPAQASPYTLAYRSTALAPGASYTITANFTTGTGTAPGTYTLFVKADGHSSYTGGTNTDNGALVEADEANNVASASVTLTRPDLSAGALTIGTIVANQNGSWTIPVTYTVTNVGAITAQASWYDLGYLSADGTLDNADQSAQASPYTLAYRSTALAPGASYTITANFTTGTGTAPGTYTFFVKADGHSSYTGGTITDGGNMADANEANNIASASVNLTRPDLSVGALTIGTIVANQNGSWTIPVTYTVTNVGAYAAQAGWYDMGYLSADGALDNTDQAAQGSPYYLAYRGSALAPGASYTITANFITTTGTTPGNYTFLVKADGHSAAYTGGTNTDGGNMADANEANNVASVSVSLTRPDLSVGALTIGTIVANQNGSWTIPVTYTVTNGGAFAAQAGWYDMGYLSADGALDNSDQAAQASPYFLTYRSTALAPGASYTITANFITTTGTTPGNYTFLVKADGHSAAYTGGTNTDGGAMADANEANNVASASVSLTRPDLSVGALTIGTIVANQNGSWTIPVTYTVTNVGAYTANASWNDMGYLSADGTLDNSDQAAQASPYFLSSRSTALAPGASYTITANFTTTTTTTPGNYTFFVKADGRSAVYNGGGATNTDNGIMADANEANNIASASVSLTRPDLSIGALTVGTIVANQNGSWTIPVTYTVTNVGAYAANASWNDMGYLSADGTLDNSDQAAQASPYFLSSRGTALAPGASYTVTANFATTTTTTPGNYTFFVKADGRSAIYNGGGATNADNGVMADANEANNIASASVSLTRPDLIISSIVLGVTTKNANGSWTFPVSYTVTNQGAYAAQGTWFDMGYLSADGTLDNADQAQQTSPYYLAYRSTALAPGASYTVNANFTTTTSTAPGTYTFFVKTDGRSAYYGSGTNTDNGMMAEVHEANNVALGTIPLANKTNTTTVLSASANPVVIGQGITLTASVSPAAAEGTITFKDGSTVIGTAALSGGVATLNASFGTSGGHGLTASYSGDNFYNTSTSSSLTETVNGVVSTTALSATPTTTSLNQSVTLSADVTGLSPTGSITFKDGATTLGTGSLSGGNTTLTTTFSVTGLHNLTAVYSGDANNQVSTSAAAGVQVNVSGVPSGTMVWQYGYDANGNARYAIDPNGNQADLAFDRLERPLTFTQPAPTSGGARPAIGLAFHADDAPASVTDPRSLVTTYGTDGLGNTTSTTSPDTGGASATHDAAGNVLTRTDARGKTATYSYDNLNRLTGISYPTGAPSTFEYDGGSPSVANSIGKLSRITDESGSTTYTHDAFGRAASKTQVVGSGSPKTFVVGYGWGTSGGAADKLAAITYPSGAQVNYAYDATGRISTITLNPVNTSGVGTNTGVSLGILSALGYTGANEVKGWTWADGSTYQRTFDSFGRLASYPLGNPAGTGAAAGATRTLNYDDAARITGYTHAAAPALDQAFAYDGLDRLNTSVLASTTYGYGYDATGNRMSRTVGASNYTNTVSPTSNRLTSVQGPSGTASYTYDAAGNITGDGIATYTYSDRGRMSRATLAGGNVDYLYNALEQRVSKVGPGSLVPTGAAYYIYDEAGRLLGEYDAAGVPIHETVYLGDTPVAVITQTRSGSPVTVQTNVANVYTDHLDTPRVVARNADQAIVWRWDQAEAFGATPANDNPNALGAFVFSQRFPGQVFDSETGLYYNWHRDYSASTGRYVQSDPIGLNGGINTYAYVEGDPVSYVDPMGLAKFGGPRKGERGHTGSPGGTPNPYKHYKPHPTDPTKVIAKDPVTGKKIEKPKPPDFDDYYRNKQKGWIDPEVLGDLFLPFLWTPSSLAPGTLYGPGTPYPTQEDYDRAQRGDPNCPPL